MPLPVTLGKVSCQRHYDRMQVIEQDKIRCVGDVVKFRALFKVMAKHCGARSIMIQLE